MSSVRILSSKVQSHPVRGAWIEIVQSGINRYLDRSRTPSGVRGLKLLVRICDENKVSVAPRQGCVD